MKFSLAIFIAALIFSSIASPAQSEADVNISQGGYGMVKTNMNTSYSHGWGAIEDVFSARVSYEFLKKKHFTITANARYSSCEVKFNETDLSDGYDPNEINLNGTHLVGQVGVTSTMRFKLFGKPCMGMAMLNSEWGEGGFARISGIAMGMFMIRANRNTQFGIGPCNKQILIPQFSAVLIPHLGLAS